MLDPLFIHQYADRILTLIDDQDEYTRSDLQGKVDKIVIDMMRDFEAKYGK